MKLFKTLMLTGICCLAGLSPAKADKILFFSPSRVLLNDADKVEVVNITNLSSAARAYKISAEDLIMTPEGVTAAVDNFDYSAKRMIRFVPRSFTLEPGERQSIRIMGRVGPDVAEGDYHTHLKFLEDVSKRNELNPDNGEGNKATISAPLAYETMIPVILSHGNVETKLTIEEASISKDGDKIKINVKIGRSGNGQGYGYIHTHHIASDGSSSSITPRRTAHIYRELDQRSFSYDFVMPGSLSDSGKIRVYLHDTQDDDAEPIAHVDLDLP